MAEVTTEIDRPQRSLRDLINFVEMDNIAEDLDEYELNAIAQQVIDDYEADDNSMEEWKQYTKCGLEMAKPALEPRSEPWEDAANFKSPALQQAAYRFGERSSRELLRPKNLVRYEVVGNDPDESKQARGDRVQEYMNYQVNHEIPDWRDCQRKLLYAVPNMGTVFKKTYFDPLKEHLVSDLIQYPNFAIDQATQSMEYLDRFTHILKLTRNNVKEYERMGLWLDIDVKLDGDEDEDSDSSSHDALNEYLEQQTLYDLDGDGYEEPYIITVHRASAKVVRIKARFEYRDILVKHTKEGVKTLDNFLRVGVNGPELREVVEIDPSVAQLRALSGDAEEPTRKISVDQFELIKITPARNLTMYGFMPSTDGTFLSVGYFYLLAALVDGVNATTNQLINAGTLSTQQSGYLAKGMRKRLGDDRFKPGQLKETDVQPQDLQNSILYHNFKEPSAVLAGLTGEMRGVINELTGSVDIGEITGGNTAAATVLLLLEETQSATTSLMAEQARSMSKEFQVMYNLNAIYADPITYQEVLDDPQANYEADFTLGGIDLIPTANPEMSNGAMRIQQAQMIKEDQEFLTAAGVDPREIAERYLEGMNFERIDELLPEPTEDFMAAQAANQQAQADATQAQTRLINAQAAALEAQAQDYITNAATKAQKLRQEVEKIKSETIKNLEQAETEQSKNQIDIYTARLQGIQAIEDMLLAAQAEQRAERESMQVQPNANP